MNSNLVLLLRRALGLKLAQLAKHLMTQSEDTYLESPKQPAVQPIAKTERRYELWQVQQLIYLDSFKFVQLGRDEETGRIFVLGGNLQPDLSIQFEEIAELQ
jgi:hypothetical protein